MRSTAAPVIVVGAGPAGCAAALGLARDGVEVLLLEAGRFPRDKVCGDVLLPGARLSLESLGVDTRLLEARAHLVRGARYHTPAGRAHTLPFVDLAGVEQPWWVVPRLEFDALLAQEAVRAGVELREQQRVVDVLVRDGAVGGVVAQQADGSRVNIVGRAVLAADGASSAVARALGRFAREPAHLCLSLRGYTELGEAGDAELFSIYTTAETLPGCGWLVPMGGGRVNVGLGVIRGDLERRGLRIRPLLDAVAARHPEFAAARQRCEHFAGWSLPGGTQPLSRSTAGVLLLGDAGSMVDPFTGHGIHTALDAGVLAAEELGAALAAGDLSATRLARFDARWQQRWDLEMQIGRVLQRLSASPWRIQALLGYVEKRPRLKTLVGGLVGHAYQRAELLRVGTLGRALGRRRTATEVA